MPRYDYKCTACGHVYEKREGFDAPSLQHCPACNGEARRVLVPPAIVFKGSGWYATDSRKGHAGTDRSTGTSDAGSSDEKPAASTSDTAKSDAGTKSDAAAKSSVSAPAAAD